MVAVFGIIFVVEIDQKQAICQSLLIDLLYIELLYMSKIYVLYVIMLIFGNLLLIYYKKLYK